MMFGNVVGKRAQVSMPINPIPAKGIAYIEVDVPLAKIGDQAIVSPALPWIDSGIVIAPSPIVTVDGKVYITLANIADSSSIFEEEPRVFNIELLSSNV